MATNTVRNDLRSAHRETEIPRAFCYAADDLHAKPLVSAQITTDLDDDAALELLVAAHETVDHGHCWACGAEPALPAPGVSVEELVLIDVESRAGTERRALCPQDAFGCVSCGDATGTIQSLDEWKNWLECPACFAGRVAQRRMS